MASDQKYSTTANPNETLPAPPRTALVFGDYEVVDELGEGGMGRVYKAVDRKLGRAVAIKVLRSTDPFECSRFRGEAEMIASLDHTNIIKIFSIEQTEDCRPYLVLEFAEGGSLDRELGGQPQEPRRAAEMIETLARAVHYAHQKGVIHRDLKPANVLRCKDKVLKLTDFGLAKELEVSSGMTPSGAVMGTPSYMSPEQADGKIKQLGPPADVYGLGAILYEMLTGRPPFRGVNIVDTLEQVRWAEPAPPSRLAPRLPRDLSTICLKCLQKSPGRRYQTAGELADDLRRWMNGETIAARPAPSWERAWRQMRRRPWEAATVTASVLLVVLMVFGWAFMVRKNARDKVRDEKEVTEQKIQGEKEEASQKLRKQANHSLHALNEIRSLVLEGGKLSRVTGLEPLYAALNSYYEKLIAQQDDGYDHNELADGLVQIGNLFRRTGEMTKALSAYKQAEKLCQSHAQKDPKTRRTLAEARLLTGRVAFELGDDTATESACVDAESRWEAERKVTEGNDRDDATRNLAEVWHLRGELLRRKLEFKEAERAYETAIRFRTELAGSVLELEPKDLAQLKTEQCKRALNYLTDLGRGYGYLGDVQLDAKNATDAERTYWKSHEIRQKVSEVYKTLGTRDGNALDAEWQFARSWSNFIDLHTRARALGTARYFAQTALKYHEKLVADDPTNTLYKIDLCNRLIQIAELELLLGGHNPTDTANMLSRAQKVPTDDSSAKGGYSRGTRGTLAKAQLLRGVLFADTDSRLARDELRQALELFVELCEERPGVTVESTSLFYKAATVSLLAELDKVPLAEPRWQGALDALGQAIEKRYQGIPPDSIRGFRAFRALEKDERFKHLLDKLRS